MGLIIDIIVVAIIAINIFICYKKGLVKLAVGLVAFIGSLLIAFVLYRPISNAIIENTQYDENIENAIIENFSVKEEVDKKEENTDIIKYFENIVDDSVNKSRNEIVTEAAKIVSIKSIEILTIIGLFIVARIVLILLTFVTDLITSLPILKQFNEIGGVLYGIVKSLLIIYFLLAIIFIIISSTGNIKIAEIINSTFITKFFYEHNLILNILF